MALTNDFRTNLVDITLEDTYERLKNVKCHREEEIKGLIDIAQNNDARTFGLNVTPEDILLKRSKFVQSLTKFVKQDQPKDLFNSNTPDFYSDALKDLENEVKIMEELDKITDKEIEELQNDIAYMEKRKTAFEQIKETSLSTSNKKTETKFKNVMNTTNNIFAVVKKDLALVVEILFPNNEPFQDFLFILTRAFNKGGDDVYINVTPGTRQFVHFLEDASIVQFHPNDNTRIKLRNL